MKKKTLAWLGAMCICCMIGLGGCGNQEAGQTETEGTAQEAEQPETGGSEQEAEQPEAGGDEPEAGQAETGGDEQETGQAGTEKSGQEAGQTETEESGQESGQAETEESGQETEQITEMDYEKFFEGLELTESYKKLDETNPLMTQRFGADPYAMVYDGRVYFYMTADAFEYDGGKNIVENTYSKIRSINVISTADMVNFTDHGAIQAATATGAATWANNSWAPAVAWKEIDGQPKFFLYFADGGGGIGVLTADSPTGPFKDPLGKGLITRETPNCSDVLWLFDPAVLVDDDGTAYLYFGGGVPEGKESDPGTARVVQLGDDMISIVGEPVTLDVPYLFEDSGIHKANGKYYYTYCTNWQVDEAGTTQYGFHNAEIASMESDSPMGPFTYKETILENPGKYCGLYGNNHHCIFSFNGNWYITYHSRALEKAMGVEHGYRSTCVDTFTMGEDGTIGIIPQTTSGREQLCPVDPYGVNRGMNIAVQGGLESVPADEESQASRCGNMAVGGIETGDFLMVKGVDFGDASPTKWSAWIRNKKGEQGVIQLRADSPDGDVLGYLATDQESAEFEELTTDLEQEITGVHDLFLIFYGEGYELDTWQFTR